MASCHARRPVFKVEVVALVRDAEAVGVAGKETLAVLAGNVLVRTAPCCSFWKKVNRTVHIRHPMQENNRLKLRQVSNEDWC